MKIKINVSYYPHLKGEDLLGNDVTNGIITTIFFPEFKTNTIPKFYAKLIKGNSFQSLIDLIKEHEINNIININVISDYGITEYSIICSGYPTIPELRPSVKKRKDGSLRFKLEHYIRELFSGNNIDDYLWNKEKEAYINIFSHYEQQYFWGDNPETTILEFYTDIPEDGIKKFLLSYILSDFMKTELAIDKANIVCTAHMAIAAGITLKDILPPP